MKSEKADKAAIDSEVKILLDLKNQYKKSSGQDWKPPSAVPAKDNTKPPADATQLSNEITLVGDKVSRNYNSVFVVMLSYFSLFYRYEF